MRVRFRTVDVFTDRLFTGNQLAVVLDAEALSAEQMQNIAAEFNYSETSFILSPESSDHEARVRIFTPKSEVPFAGHPPIGAAAVLGWEGNIHLGAGSATLILEEAVGEVPVTLSQRSNEVIFAQLTAAQLPEPGPEPPSRKDLQRLFPYVPRTCARGNTLRKRGHVACPSSSSPSKTLR